MKRSRILFILSLMAFAWIASPSVAQKRVALVIGNSNYTKIQSLPNPNNDARLMADTLGKLDFDVILAIDVDFVAMRRAIKTFSKKLHASGEGTTVLFYYAGHAVQVQGENFLIPLNVEVADEAELKGELISVFDVIGQMERTDNLLNLVILNASHNNPFKGKLSSISGGLAKMTWYSTSDTLVAFAAAPGQVAADSMENSTPYTKALASAMQVPGLSIDQIFEHVRIQVETDTSNKQTPWTRAWEAKRFRGFFFFTPKKPG